MDSSSAWVWRWHSCALRGLGSQALTAWAPLWFSLFTLLKISLAVFPVVHSEISKIAQIIIKHIPAWLRIKTYCVIRYTRKPLICKSLLLLVEFMQNPHCSWWQVAPSAVPVFSRSHQSGARTLATPLGQLAKYFIPWNNQIAWSRKTDIHTQ